MKLLDKSKKTMRDRQARRKGLRESVRKRLLARRKAQSGSVRKDVIRHTSLMNRIKKESAQRAATRISGATARAKDHPTSRGKGLFSRLWNRKTG